MKRSRAGDLLAIDFSSRTLQDFPINPIGLKHLTELNLSHNALRVLSENIGELINLTDLFLNNNYLTLLPATFKHLEKLQVLDLRNNKLKRLFENVTDLKCLKRLSVEGNPLPVEEVRGLIELVDNKPELSIDIAGELLHVKLVRVVLYKYFM